MTVKKTAKPRLLFIAAALVTVGLATSAVAARLRSDDAKTPADGAKPSQLAQNLVGSWALAGTPSATRTAVNGTATRVIFGPISTSGRHAQLYAGHPRLDSLRKVRRGWPAQGRS